MKLHEELYFEITAEGTKEALQKFISFVVSGELDDYFEFSRDFIIYDDNFDFASPNENVTVTFANDDFGIEIDDFDPEDFVEAFCKGSKNVSLCGHLYDIDDEEFRFTSLINEIGYTDTDNVTEFNDELDEEAYKEELRAKKDDYDM